MTRGTVKTSAIFIAAGGKTAVYRTLEEIPAALRKKLIRSTGGANAGTVLIADRRGARELLRTQAEILRKEQTPAARRRDRAAGLLRLMAERWMELLLAGVLGLLLWLLVSIRL